MGDTRRSSLSAQVYASEPTASDMRSYDVIQRSCREVLKLAYFMRRGEKEIEKNKRVSLAFFLAFTKLAFSPEGDFSPAGRDTEIAHFSPRSGVKTYRRYHLSAIWDNNSKHLQELNTRALSKTPP
ncbi:hypothetical protein KOW79_012760 [Hemibagrus wyckioides]|uniref:Uncharacterized protein n=1 Tax=Hemibagrus wyckioides TaxID=337641 RepID=A0A9D3SKQ5_9TELE|nr:hypothetical protein KOW79_012760 [Hemibagrus wyckioides]